MGAYIVTSAAEVVHSAIQRAPDYHDGQIEALRRQVDKLVEIVAFMAGQLPAAAQHELAAQHYCEIKDPTNG